MGGMTGGVVTKIKEVEVIKHVHHRPTDVSVEAVHRTLRQHPNFKIPELDVEKVDIRDPKVLATYVTEIIASYVSPPKLDDENDEMECIDVATAIREKLLPEILELVGKKDKEDEDIYAMPWERKDFNPNK